MNMAQSAQALINIIIAQWILGYWRLQQILFTSPGPVKADSNQSWKLATSSPTNIHQLTMTTH